MRLKHFLLIVLLLFFTASASCSTFSEHQKREYGVLESAVTFSSDKVIGEYGDSIPADFSNEKFMNLVKDKIPKNYLETLEKYRLEIESKNSYYLLRIFDKDSNSLILFDYSCTPEVDGPVFLEPEKFDLKKLELYDKCNKQ